MLAPVLRASASLTREDELTLRSMLGSPTCSDANDYAASVRIDAVKPL